MYSLSECSKLSYSDIGMVIVLGTYVNRELRSFIHNTVGNDSTGDLHRFGFPPD